MMKDGQGKCGSNAIKNASKDTSTYASGDDNGLRYKFVRVEGYGSFVPASEDEVIDVEHLLSEPKEDKVLVDNILSFNSESPAERLAVGDFQSSLDYRQLKIDNSDCLGALNSDVTQRGREVEPKMDFLDGMLEGVEEGDLHITDCLSDACDDYLLDTDFSEKASDIFNGPNDSRFGNLVMQHQSPRYTGQNMEAAEMSEPLAVSIPVPESTSDQDDVLLDTMTVHELHEAFRSTFGRETSVKDKQWLKRRISFGLHNLDELRNVSSLLESGTSSSENEGDMSLTSNKIFSGKMHGSLKNVQCSKAKSASLSVVNKTIVHRDDLTTNSEASKVGFGLANLEDEEGERVTRKRLRKPTRRYIEESSELKSRYRGGRFESKVNSRNECHGKGFGATSLVSKQEPRGGSCIQVPFGPQERKGRPKKNSSIMWHGSDTKADRIISVPSKRSYLEPFPSELQDDMSDDCVTIARTEKGSIRRKHHRLWTLSEVMKLIDGVAQYGVGRWTDIKRLLFSSSAYRTSVDLKDKWRNLLRASCAELQSKREVEQGRKHAIRPIPPSVLRRVSELALIYPYPRERKSKLSSVPPVTSPIRTSASRETPVSGSERIVQRRNLTWN